MGVNWQKQKNQIFLLLICKEKPTLSKGVDLVANSAAAGTLNEEATFDLLLSMLTGPGSILFGSILCNNISKCKKFTRSV